MPHVSNYNKSLLALVQMCVFCYIVLLDTQVVTIYENYLNAHRFSNVNARFGPRPFITYNYYACSN